MAMAFPFAFADRRPLDIAKGQGKDVFSGLGANVLTRRWMVATNRLGLNSGRVQVTNSAWTNYLSRKYFGTGPWDVYYPRFLLWNGYSVSGNITASGSPHNIEKMAIALAGSTSLSPVTVSSSRSLSMSSGAFYLTDPWPGADGGRSAAVFG